MSKIILYSGLFILGTAFGAGSLFALQFLDEKQFETWTAKESIFLDNGSRISKGSVLLKNLNPRCELRTNPSGYSNLGLLFVATPNIYEKFDIATSPTLPYSKIEPKQ